MGDDRKAITSAMIRGMSVIVRLFADVIIEDAFVKRLSTHNPERIERLAVFNKGPDSVGITIARIMHRHYNKGRSKNRLPDRFYEIEDAA